MTEQHTAPRTHVYDTRSLTDDQRSLADDIASGMGWGHEETCAVWQEDADGCSCPLLQAVADGLNDARVVEVVQEMGYDPKTQRGDRLQRRAFRSYPRAEAAQQSGPLDVRMAAQWIVREDDERHQADNACAECVPDGPILVEGFRCVPHQARAYLGFGSFTSLIDLGTEAEQKAYGDGVADGLRQAAEQSGPLDVEAIRAAMHEMGWSRRFIDGHAARFTETLARLIPQPAQQADTAREPLPLTGHIHQPEDCPWCKALVELGGEAALALAEPAQPADTALREALERLIWDAIGDNEGCAHHYGNLTYSCSCTVAVEQLQRVLASQPSPSEPEERS